MHAVLVGPDRDLEAALHDHGVDTARVEAPATAEALAEAGVADADVLVVSDVSEATAVPIAREANPDLLVVVYAERTMPEFVRGQVDYALDPAVLPPAAIVEELLGADA